MSPVEAAADSEGQLSGGTEERGGQIWHPNWVRLAPNGTNVGFAKVSFSTILTVFQSIGQGLPKYVKKNK